MLGLHFYSGKEEHSCITARKFCLLGGRGKEGSVFED